MGNAIKEKIIELLKKNGQPLSIYEIAQKISEPVSSVRYYCVGIGNYGGHLLKENIIKIEYARTEKRNHFARIKLNETYITSLRAGEPNTPASTFLKVTE